MNQRLMGMEMECGFAVLTLDGAGSGPRMAGSGASSPPNASAPAIRGPDPARCSRDEALNRFYHLVTQLTPHLPGRESAGVFLHNSSRFYTDCGHPEITTPECSTPEEVVRYKLAAEAILARAAAALNREMEPKARVVLFGNNFDYLTGNTWGCHESYLHRADPGLFAAHLVPHLVSRIIYTGVGGFAFGGGLEFLVSPRVGWLAQEVSSESTNTRGILHTRDESLSQPGYRRAHLICGENNRSQLATYLKMGTTALVILLIERGFKPGETVGPARSLEAMRTFSADPACRAAVPTIRGGRTTALQIQRHYLTLAKSCLGRPFMPDWAEPLCVRWEDTLNRLDGAPDSVSTRLDWAMKYAMYRQFAEARGFRWEQRRNPLPKPAVEEQIEFDVEGPTFQGVLRAAYQRARLAAQLGEALPG